MQDTKATNAEVSKIMGIEDTKAIIAEDTKKSYLDAKATIVEDTKDSSFISLL